MDLIVYIHCANDSFSAVVGSTDFCLDLLRRGIVDRLMAVGARDDSLHVLRAQDERLNVTDEVFNTPSNFYGSDCHWYLSIDLDMLNPSFFRGGHESNA